MGIFLLFPLASLAGLILAKRRVPGDAAPGADRTFERTALFAAVVPLLFAVYLRARCRRTAIGRGCCSGSCS